MLPSSVSGLFTVYPGRCGTFPANSSAVMPGGGRGCVKSHLFGRILLSGIGVILNERMYPRPSPHTVNSVPRDAR